jgi:hypothetical protein
MKRITIWLLWALMSISVCSHAQQTKKAMITSQERDAAIQLLMQTDAGFFAAVDGLSEAQLKFKSAVDKWSIEECVKHMATSEAVLWEIAAAALKEKANPALRSAIKFSDADLIKAVEDRSHKSRTFAALEPANSPYNNVEDALAAFKLNREKLITFVKSTQADLRNHVIAEAIGTFDTYQFILLIAAHSNRHTQQIDEVKSSINFPK